jgi:hypothetical protein
LGLWLNTHTEEDEQPQHNQQAEHPNMAVQQEVRRSKRTIQKPSKTITV